MKMMATCTQSRYGAYGQAKESYHGSIRGTGRDSKASRCVLLSARPDRAGAATELELTPEELAEIEDVQIEAQGERYSEANQRMVDR